VRAGACAPEPLLVPDARFLQSTLPITSVTFAEAERFCAWRGARLPSEAEWEHAARALAPAGRFLGAGRLDATAAGGGEGLKQMFGDLWEWTSSAYSPYPGFRAAAGAVGEYNGKFMSGQMVLRGGAAITPDDHIRISYRNFFPPAARWAFSGVRLAADA